MKVLIQIGLGSFVHNAEYIYVTRRDWPREAKELHSPEFPFIPQELWGDGEQWNYVGVDVNAAFVEMHRVHYQENRRAGFLNIGLGSEGKDLTGLFRQAGEPTALVLSVIGGSNCLVNYDWAYEPNFIVVLTHTIEQTHRLFESLLDRYYLVHFQTNTKNAYNRVSFLHRDCISEETKGVASRECLHFFD